MTEYELLRYNMSEIEQKEWIRLRMDIINKIMSVYIPNIFDAIKEEIVDKRTMAKEPFYGARGYILNEGFYSVREGDRGHVEKIFSNVSYNEARSIILKKCAYDISYEYVTSHRLELQNEHKRLWHYCEVEDGIDYKEHMKISHIEEEQEGWIYDKKYDYRKHWFELLLYIDKRVLDNDEYEKEILMYQDYLNYHMTDKKWVFNKEKDEFHM